MRLLLLLVIALTAAPLAAQTIEFRAPDGTVRGQVSLAEAGWAMAFSLDPAVEWLAGPLPGGAAAVATVVPASVDSVVVVSAVEALDAAAILRSASASPGDLWARAAVGAGRGKVFVVGLSSPQSKGDLPFRDRGEYVMVDVFYGTDRARTGSVEPASFYGGDRGSLEYGRAVVSVPKGHTVGELESPAWWRFEFSQDPAKHIILQDVVPLGREAALAQIRGAVAKSDDQSAFVFIHGYNVGFEEAARRTGQLAYDLSFDGAPIFFSWPSDASVRLYTRDEADVEWAWPHLYEFLRDVARETGASRVHVIAHSMGNRAVTSALKEFARSGAELPVFDQVLLAAPDIDAQVFAEQIAPVIPPVARRVTLYASSRDKALAASKAVHGYPRAGDSGDGLVVIDGIDTVDASSVDTDLLGHGYYADAEPILQDVYMVLEAGIEPERRGLVPRLKEVLRYWVLGL